MNKTPRLSRSGIEYLDYAWNFYSGCLNKKLGICLVQNCWAEAITKRMKHNYPNAFEPTYYPEAFLSPLYLKKPSIIGCAFMGDLFGDWVDPFTQDIRVNYPFGGITTDSLKGHIFRVIEARLEHTFLFLTKCPQNLIKWSPFPQNTYIGVSVTNQLQYDNAVKYLAEIEAPVKFLSFEPLLERIELDIIG